MKMTAHRVLMQVARQEDVNFLLTNRIPRRLATRAMGRISRVEQPAVRALSLALWRLFCDVDLSDARQARFRSLHEAFIRELKEEARPIDTDPDVIVSPCDAIVGACGPIRGTEILQIKGMPYRLGQLLGSETEAESLADGVYVTLRLTAGMYHRFHAPDDARVESVTYLGGDTWNVNPIALKRIEALFCRNERAVLRLRLARSGDLLTLVPVAAILVAGLKLGFLEAGMDLRAGGDRTIPCAADLRRGEEMGWFEHGSTIIALAPPGYDLCASVVEGQEIRMGRPLFEVMKASEPSCS